MSKRRANDAADQKAYAQRSAHRYDRQAVPKIQLQHFKRMTRQ